MKIAVIGLGYVGLPLAIALSKERIFDIVGFDIDASRIQELKAGGDRNREESDLNQKAWLQTSCDDFLSDCTVYIVCVPTPINADKKPDLRAIESATQRIGRHLKSGDIVIYESTVWPGMTEEICGGILENISGLKLNSDFYLGYSPERINPGDSEHTIRNIKKIISASHPFALEVMKRIYLSICYAGIHTAPSIKIAEAAKCIENIQRDINIALMNEFKMLFDRMNIDLSDILMAARTKWNFLDFKPGLVGGHCIGVDPYYLAERAKDFGFNPQMILTGRAINDDMSKYWFEKISSRLNMAARPRILVLGCTFKPDVSDIRNSKVFDLVHYFDLAGCDVKIFDPIADFRAVKEECGKDLSNSLDFVNCDALILAVGHKQFLQRNYPDHLPIFDISGSFPDPLPKNVVR